MNSILFNTIGNNKFENDSNKRLILAKKPPPKCRGKRK